MDHEAGWRQRGNVVADAVAGVSIAGLLVPEAVAYSGLAGLPPSAGLVGLLAGLVCYGLIGHSRFAIVAATSSSGALVGAATVALAGADEPRRAALASGLVLLTGALFIVASLARLGAMSNFISRPVLRGFAFALAISISLRQVVQIAGLPVNGGSALELLGTLATQWPRWNLAGLAFGAAALLVLRLLSGLRRVPGPLLVLLAGVAAGHVLDLPRLGIAVVGPIDVALLRPAWPALGFDEWLRLGEVALAAFLLLFSESFGTIGAVGLRHGDTAAPDRDLAAIGIANVVSGLLRGMPVGAGYSATVANEAAGAATRAAGWTAAVVIAGVIGLALHLIELTPEPVLAAIIINALWHAMSPAAFAPYFGWRRDRLVVVCAVVAVLALGVLDGLLASIVVSLALFLRDLAEPRLSELGRLAGGHDFLSITAHPGVQRVPGVLILRPEAPLFFGNADAMLASARRRIDAAGPCALVLSLEETPDLDGTSVEAVLAFTHELGARGVPVALARLKDPVIRVLQRAADRNDGRLVLVEQSVDDAVAQLLQRQGP